MLTYLPNSPDLSSIMGQGRFGSIRTNRILGRKVVCSDQYMYPHGGLQFYQSVPVYPVLEMQASYLFSRAEVTVKWRTACKLFLFPSTCFISLCIAVFLLLSTFCLSSRPIPYIVTPHLTGFLSPSSLSV